MLRWCIVKIDLKTGAARQQRKTSDGQSPADAMPSRRRRDVALKNLAIRIWINAAAPTIDHKTGQQPINSGDMHLRVRVVHPPGRRLYKRIAILLDELSQLAKIIPVKLKKRCAIGINEQWLYL
jgi:hypothetical protein